MAMRIWHQSFTVLEDVPAYTDALRKEIARVCRPDTEVVLHGQIPGTYTDHYPGSDLAHSVIYELHELQWLAAALEAERQGFDAIVQANAPSPKTRQIRTLVDIPVVGYGESAFNLGGLYGRRIGMLFFNTQRRDFWPENIRQWGAAERFAGIEKAGASFDEVVEALTDETKRPQVVAKIVAQAEKLVAERDVDVIVPGEMPLNLLLSLSGVSEIAGATVWDGIAVSFKFAEMLVDLQAVSKMRPSNHGFFHSSPARGRVDEVLAFYGLDKLGSRFTQS
jgi:Asp/Glu/hydantoin racemase